MTNWDAIGSQLDKDLYELAAKYRAQGVSIGIAVGLIPDTEEAKTDGSWTSFRLQGPTRQWALFNTLRAALNRAEEIQEEANDLGLKNLDYTGLDR